MGFVESPRDFVGVVMKSLGLTFNATSSDATNCGIAKSTIMERAAQLRRQVSLSLNLTFPPPGRHEDLS